VLGRVFLPVIHDINGVLCRAVGSSGLKSRELLHDIGSNLICSEKDGTELALDSLHVLVADEIAETRIGMVQGFERRGECTMYGQGATKHGRIGRMVVHEDDARGRDQIQ
jgi:hypothetical protein